jgi:hypothetical protein
MFLGRSISKRYTIDGANGDTGGTLTTTGFKAIDNYSIQVEVDTGPAGYNTNLTHYISGKTIVVAYDDPTDGHTVRIQVWGPKI